jgi:hypothetical protein
MSTSDEFFGHTGVTRGFKAVTRMLPPSAFDAGWQRFFRNVRVLPSCHIDGDLPRPLLFQDPMVSQRSVCFGIASPRRKAPIPFS